jgi:hypothetical protein
MQFMFTNQSEQRAHEATPGCGHGSKVNIKPAPVTFHRWAEGPSVRSHPSINPGRPSLSLLHAVSTFVTSLSLSIYTHKLFTVASYTYESSLCVCLIPLLLCVCAIRASSAPGENLKITNVGLDVKMA